MGCCSTFPCCMELPLDMGVQFIAIFDIVTSFLCLISYCAVYAVDLFAAQQKGMDPLKDPHHISEEKNDDESDSNKFKPPFIPDRQYPEYLEFATTVATTKRPWTLRTTTTEEPLFDEDADTESISKDYAKISNITRARHDIIHRKCTKDEKKEYIFEYLFGHGLEKTSDLWTEFLAYHIGAEVIYIVMSVLILLISCCFVEHRGAKVLLMIVWWTEWIGIYLEVLASVVSQSSRLCIIEWGFAVRGQTAILACTLFRLVIFKMYELLLIAMYISDLLHHGYLKNETLDQQAEKKPVRNFYKQLYALEEHKGNDPLALASRDTSYAIGFQDIHPSNVDKIQAIMEAEPIASTPDKKPQVNDN